MDGVAGRYIVRCVDFFVCVYMCTLSTRYIESMLVDKKV